IAIIIIGVMGFDPPVLSGTMDGYPAQEAGLKEGDEILKLNHYRTHFYREVSVYMYMHPGQPVNVTYKRDGNKYKTTIVPKLDEETGRYLMGVQGTNKREKGGIFTTLRYGLYEIKYQVYITFESLKMLITRKVSLNEVSGPVGIVKIIGDIYEASAPDGLLYVMMNLFSISVLLSANLGVMNLLPIPALDGGRLLIYIVEIIRGRRMSEDLENKINIVGFAVLMMLMLVILANDIIKLVHI
ncbi:MAG: RIP metalloprotease RseP, partial [Lachnospiraceae bacterium]|nr:RIP metalloprotease RseP [Lachnospiraceae bacterium]